MSASLRDLLERVEKTTKPNYALERDLWNALLPAERRPEWRRTPPLTTSLDAAVALVAEMLPGAFWETGTSQFDRQGRHANAFVWCRDEPSHEAWAATPPLALLAALLSALLSQEASHD